MRGRNKKKPPTIYVNGDRRSRDHHEVRGHLHSHGRVSLSTEGTKRFLSDEKMWTAVPNAIMAVADAVIRCRRRWCWRRLRRHLWPTVLTAAPNTSTTEANTEIYMISNLNPVPSTAMSTPILAATMKPETKTVLFCFYVCFCFCWPLLLVYFLLTNFCFYSSYFYFFIFFDWQWCQFKYCHKGFEGYLGLYEEGRGRHWREPHFNGQ